MTLGEANNSGSETTVIQLDAVVSKVLANHASFAQQTHVGFSLPHLSLDMAQLLQLCCSLGPAGGAILWRTGGVKGMV
jgi:hypothetical protein